MTTRRDPPPPPAPPSGATDSTALMERPYFSDAHGGDDDRDVFSDDELPDLPRIGADGDDGDDPPTAKLARPKKNGADEATDPSRPLQSRSPGRVAEAEAPTGRFDIGSLDDFDGSLPSAHVSELELSDLDGEAHEGGAPTAIMQLPPEMMAHHGHHHDGDGRTDSGPHEEAVEMRRWSAGPPGARHDMPHAGAPPPSAPPSSTAPAVGVTMPALSLDAIRAAAEGLHDVGVRAHAHAHAHTPMPLPPAPHAQATTLTVDDLPRAAPPGALKALVEDALGAVTNAQALAGDDNAVQRHLSRAVEALSRLLEHVD